MNKRIEIAKIPIDLVDEKIIEQKVEESLSSNSELLMLYANAHTIQLANNSELWLINFYRSAGMVLCDGAGVQLGAMITRQSVPQKIAFNIWFWNFLKFIEGRYTIFLLGGTDDVNEESSKNFLIACPNLNIVGRHHGYFDKSDPGQSRSILALIEKCKPDILLIGFGQPIQEKWISENADNLHSKVIIACGGAFNFFAGRHPVAPWLIRKMCLEWLYRLSREPKRLFWRYTIGNIKFLRLVVKQSLRC